MPGAKHSLFTLLEVVVIIVKSSFGWVFISVCTEQWSGLDNICDGVGMK